jgi:hypothetical protein
MAAAQRPWKIGWVFAGNKLVCNSMKRFRWQSATFLQVSLFLLATNFSGAAFAQTSATNAIRSATPIPAKVVSASEEIIPLIEIRDVPITTAIAHLARAAQINYALDVRMEFADGWKPEPFINVKLTNITAAAALKHTLERNAFALTKDEATHIALIGLAGQTPYTVDADLLLAPTNGPTAPADSLIPLVQFADVPLDVALAHLMRQTGLHLELSPKLVSTDDAWELARAGRLAIIGGVTNRADTPAEKYFDHMPVVSVRWQDVTARQCIIALCRAYGLALVKEEESGILQILPREVKRRHRLNLR